MSEPTYVETTALELARVLGMQRGSIAHNAIIGCLREVIERCARRAKTCWCMVPGCDEHEIENSIRALGDGR